MLTIRFFVLPTESVVCSERKSNIVCVCVCVSVCDLSRVCGWTAQACTPADDLRVVVAAAVAGVVALWPPCRPSAGSDAGDAAGSLRGRPGRRRGLDSNGGMAPGRLDRSLAGVRPADKNNNNKPGLYTQSVVENESKSKKK